MFGLSSVFLSSVACPSVCLSFVRPSVSGYEARKHSQRTKGKRATGRKAFGFGRRERTGGGGGGVVHSYTHCVLKGARAFRMSLRTLTAFRVVRMYIHNVLKWARASRMFVCILVLLLGGRRYFLPSFLPSFLPCRSFRRFLVVPMEIFYRTG